MRSRSHRMRLLDAAGHGLAAIAVFGVAMTVAAAALPETPERGDPAARLPDSAVSSDIWEIVVRLDSGGWIFLQATVTNAGISDLDAAVVGHVVDSEGTAHEFHKIRREGQWRLSEDRRGIDLGSIALDLRQPTAQIRVDKSRVVLALEIERAAEPAWSDALTGSAYGFDLLAAGAPARGTLWLEGMGTPASVREHAALTHRWLGAYESSLIRRRTEFFALDDRGALYYTEVTTANGETRRWLVAQKDGKTAHRSTEVTLEPSGSAGLAFAGGPLRIEAPGVSGRIDRPRVLLRDEPIARIPWLVRWFVSPRATSRSEWRAAPFELTLHDAKGSDLTLSGTGVITVAQFGTDASAPRTPGTGEPE